MPWAKCWRGRDLVAMFLVASSVIVGCRCQYIDCPHTQQATTNGSQGFVRLDPLQLVLPGGTDDLGVVPVGSSCVSLCVRGCVCTIGKCQSLRVLIGCRS